MLSGTSVARDFVELPSQWFEHWLDSNLVLQKFALNAEDGSPIDRKFLSNLLKARHFNSAFETIEYLVSAIVDIEIHSNKSCKSPIDTEKELMKRIKLHPAILPRHKVSNFAHIFSGGYASSYYSYIWSEMMDEDAFAAFSESGDIFNPKLANSFEKNILSTGGSEEPEKLYKSFRGKIPSFEVLIKSRQLEKFV